jgi:preprotein translocase subunit SecA
MRVEIVQQSPPEQPSQLPYMEAHKVDPTTGEDELALAGAPLAPALADNGHAVKATAHAAPQATAQAERNPKNPASWGKVGRNEPCPCGSGKKFKHCHGKLA